MTAAADAPLGGVMPRPTDGPSSRASMDVDAATSAGDAGSPVPGVGSVVPLPSPCAAVMSFEVLKPLLDAGPSAAGKPPPLLMDSATRSTLKPGLSPPPPSPAPIAAVAAVGSLFSMS